MKKPYEKKVYKPKISEEEYAYTIDQLDKLIAQANYELSIAMEDSDYHECLKANNKIRKYKYLKTLKEEGNGT